MGSSYHFRTASAFCGEAARRHDGRRRSSEVVVTFRSLIVVLVVMIYSCGRVSGASELQRDEENPRSGRELGASELPPQELPPHEGPHRERVLKATEPLLLRGKGKKKKFSLGDGGSTAAAWAGEVRQDSRNCPPCEDLFSKLKTSSSADRKRVQETFLQLRGEPKSGTTFMFSWAFGILQRTCLYLQGTYGKRSCRVQADELQPLPIKATLIFEPELGGRSAPCSCDTVDRVSITINTRGKHLLPVPETCKWYHYSGVARDGTGCRRQDGREVKNYLDLWSCMREAKCEVSDDDAVQFVAMRDPRAVAVSSYFHVKKHPDHYLKNYAMTHSVDESVLFSLSTVCRWTTIRHILFDGMMPDRSEVFWYVDALGHPEDWHYRWSHMAGLTLPSPWMRNITLLAGQGSWATEVNDHEGGHEVSPRTRTWRDEVSPEIIDEMDDILRSWLPPVLLARFGLT